MAMVVDIGKRQPRELPSPRDETSAELEFLAAMHIAVGQISDGLDRGAPVDTAPVEAVREAGPADAVFAHASLHVFEVGRLMLGQHAAHACDIRMAVEEWNGGGEERRPHLHVPIDQPDVAATAVLKAE